MNDKRIADCILRVTELTECNNNLRMQPCCLYHERWVHQLAHSVGYSVPRLVLQFTVETVVCSLFTAVFTRSYIAPISQIFNPLRTLESAPASTPFYQHPCSAYYNSSTASRTTSRAMLSCPVTKVVVNQKSSAAISQPLVSRHLTRRLPRPHVGWARCLFSLQSI